MQKKRFEPSEEKTTNKAQHVMFFHACLLERGLHES